MYIKNKILSNTKCMTNIKSFKLWLNISNPKRFLFFMQIITAIIPAIINVLIAIPSASLINNLSVFNYQEAYYTLIKILILITIEFLFYNINYLLYNKQIKHIYKELNNALFTKILSASDIELNTNSKEKIINTISNNLLNIVEFSNNFSHKFCYLITSIIMLSFVFYYSIVLGFITILISFFTYLLYLILNHFLLKRTIMLQEAKDEILENFSYVYDGINISSDLNLSFVLKDKYNNSVNNIIKNHKKEHILKLFSNEWVKFLYQILFYLTTFYLISLVEKNSFSLTTYLLLTPYILNTINNTFKYFSLYHDLSIVKVSCLRIKTLLDMQNKDLLVYGNNKTSDIEGIISFSNLSFLPNNNELIFGKLNLFSLEIEKNKLYLIQGSKKCGKRALFYLLKRKLKPTTGTITFDNINIYDFDHNSYINNISFTTSHPYFFNDSIINNLKLINNNSKKIKQLATKLNINQQILNLPNGYNTNILKETNKISPYLKFMLGIIRSLLQNSEIMCIYEFPIGLTNEEIKNITNTLKLIKTNHTILIFSATNPLGNIFDSTITIKNGKVSNINE